MAPEISRGRLFHRASQIGSFRVLLAVTLLAAAALVSAQEQPVVVPDVRRQPVEEAIVVIKKAGLSPGALEHRLSAQPPGSVLEQSLQPGTQVPL